MRLKNFRYFTDSEGYNFVLVSTDGLGIIINPDGIIVGTYSNEKISKQLQEIDPAYFTRQFLEEFVVMNSTKAVFKRLGSTLEDIMFAIKRDVEMHSKHNDEVPEALVKLIDKRLSRLRAKMSKLKEKTPEKYINEFSELVAFKSKLFRIK